MFIYHKLSLEVSGAAGSIGVLASQYIDYWHVGQTFTAPLQMTHLSSGPWQQLVSCVTCTLRWVNLLVLTSHSPLLRLGCVFSVLCVTRCIKLFSSPKEKESSLPH